VHVPSDGNPLKGYDLALAEIEKRGDGDGVSTKSKPGLFAALFKGKSNDEEDEGASAPVAGEATAASAGAMAASPADAVPMPRAKPKAGSTLQLASADAQIVQPTKSRQAAATSAEKAEPKPQTPADIINARGFWGDAPTKPKQATPALVAAISARQAVAAADPQPTASVPAVFEALAYAPPSNSPVDHSNIVAASAPILDRPGHRQGTAGSRRRDFDIDADSRGHRQRRLDARDDAGAEREHVDVHDRTGRYRHDLDADPFRQAAGRRRDELLGRPADGTGQRPVYRTGRCDAGDAVIRDAHRIAALTP
jgi:hypothetical protein